MVESLMLLLAWRLARLACGGLVLLGSLVLLPAEALAAASGEQIREALPYVFDDTYQTELPTPTSDVDSAEDHNQVRVFVVTSFLVLIGRLLFFLFLGVALGLLLFFVGDRYIIPKIRASADGSTDRLAQPFLDGGCSGFLGSAESLASDGRFGEAIHTLLHGALAEIANGLSSPMADSWTSREILRLAELPVAARQALRDLVTHVEITHFGGLACDESDYRSCRQSFERLADACARGSG